MGSALSRPRTDDMKSVSSDADPEAQVLELSTQSSRELVTAEEMSRKIFRADSKIWQLYLENAAQEATDKARILGAGLDTLLIYAGLFAGVVSSSVIDAKSRLQPDEQPRLLSDILEFLRSPGSASSRTADIPSSVYWVNGLWTMSLFGTIFSALMGFLAKAWLANYTPPKNRGQSRDAFRHYHQNKQSRHWLFIEALILIPLIVQVATFLFLAGLVIQALGDDITVGRTLLCFCAAGGLLYLWLTVIPFSTLSSPVGTPLSDLCRALRARKYTRYESEITTDFEETLFKILYEDLILSGKDPLIDGAISEVASPGFGSLWIEILCKTDTPKILHRRLRKCSKPESGRESAKNMEALEHHLLAFLCFVDPYDRILTTNIVGSSSRFELSTGNTKFPCLHHLHYPELYEAFRESLDSPFHTWDYFPPGLQPLAFALRTNILSLLSTCPMSCKAGPQMDFDPSELLNRPWEMSLQDISSTHRLHFLKAACRGLMQDQNYMPVVRTVSAYILCIRIAKASGARGSHTGRCRWSGDDQRRKTYRLAAKYIKELVKVNVAVWETTVDDTMRELLSVEVRVAGGEIRRGRASVLVNLFDSLRQPSRRLKVHAIKMLKHIFSSPNCSETELASFLTSGFAHKSLEVISRMAAYDGDEDVRDDGLGLLIALLQSHGEEELRQFIEAALKEALQSGLSAYEDRLLTSSVQFVEKLLECALTLEQGTRLDPVVCSAIPRLIAVALDDASLAPRASRLAVTLLQKLSPNRFSGDVERGVLQYRKALIFGDQSKSRSTFLEALQSLFNSEEFAQEDDRLPLESSIWSTPKAFLEQMIRETYEKLVTVAISGELAPIREAAQKLLALVVREDCFQELKATIMERLQAYTNDGSRTWRIRANVVSVLEVFARQDAALRETALKAVINLLEDSDAIGRFSPAVKAVLVNDSPKEIIASETFNHIKACWVTFLMSIAMHVSFPQAVPFFIARAVVAPPGSEIHNSVMELLKSDGFARDSECVQAFEKAVPETLRATLPGEVLPDRCNWIKILLELLPEDSGNPNPIQKIAIQALATVKKDVKCCIVNGYSEKVGHTYRSGPVGDNPSLVKSFISDALQQILGRIPSKGRTHWVETLGGLAQHYELPDAHKIIVQMALHDPDSDVRVASIKCLNQLAERGAEHSSPLAGADMIVDVEIMAEDRWWVAQLVAFQLHAQLQDVGFRYEGKIFNLALKGDTSLVRDRAARVLAELLKNDDCDTLAADVAKRLAASIANIDDRQMAKLLLKRLTGSSAYNGGQLDADVTPWHEVWIQVVMMLGKDQRLRVSDLILTEMQKAKQGDSSQSKPRCQIEELPKSTLSMLPPHIYSSLKSDKLEDREEGMSISTSWLSFEQEGSQEKESCLISSHRFHDFIKYSLRMVMKDCFENHESTKVVKDAIEALHGLTKSHSYGIAAAFQHPTTTLTIILEYCEGLKDIVSPSIPYLMRITMGAGWGHGEVWKGAKVILLEDLTRFSKELRVTTEVLDKLPAMIPNLTEDGKVVALQFVESLQFTDETATSFAKGLTPLLSATYSSFSRGIALSLLSKLHSKNMSSKDQLVGCLTSAIQEITALALDERDEVSGARTTAMQLLVALCRARKDVAFKDGTSPPNPVTKLTHLLDQFMHLLQNESLRLSVVEILSMMAADSEVRRRISLEIITLALGREGKDTSVLHGNAALLARLISDGRFEHKATDNAVLFLASTMLTRPELSPYRFEISTGLWCRYRGRDFTDIAPPSDSDPSDDFVGLFILALFGGTRQRGGSHPILQRGKEWVSQNKAATTAYEEGKVSAQGPMPRLGSS
ncbi:hypothetical protein NMY22_g1404 [Coprinellus aureogranulatus]|nr:hypothetical protein NMY22_g1404 [Coprinellus aureogranulatus]